MGCVPNRPKLYNNGMVKRNGRINFEKKIEEVCDCPNCDGKIVVKRSKRGKVFYGCNNYPRCKTALWDEPTGEKCPKCGNLFVFKGKDRTIKCNSCDYTK